MDVFQQRLLKNDGGDEEGDLNMFYMAPFLLSALNEFHTYSLMPPIIEGHRVKKQ